MNHLAKRITNLIPSPTMAIDTKAKALKKQGFPIINLSAGEPDFATPTHIKKAGIEAIKKGFTRYTSTQGIVELRELVAQKFLKENKILYDSSQIVIGVGSKQLLYTAFQVLCDTDDEVIIPIPNWSTFVEQAKLASGKPVFVKLTAPWKLTAHDIEKITTKKTKIIVLNSPSNPTSAMIDQDELQKIANLAVTNKLWVISDEIYEKLIYTAKHVSIAALNESIKERTITISGVSKSYAMTGWRLGYAGGPKEIINAMNSLQGQIISSPNAISQMAALTALEAEQSSIKDMQAKFAKRRDYLIQELKKIKQISFTIPEGAFYFFVSIEKVLNTTYPTSEKWCEGFLEKEYVALIPGEAFLYPGYFRLSFAASIEDLKEAIVRIKRFIK